MGCRVMSLGFVGFGVQVIRVCGFRTLGSRVQGAELGVFC